MPSFVASARAVSRATMSSTGTTSCATPRFSTCGMKSGVQPWILCGFHSPPDNSAAPAGSVTTMRTSGRARRIISPAPVSVPPVP